MGIILSILGILVTIFFVIGTHEAAHFLTARALHIKVLRFSIGFGKTLWQHVDKRGTEYVIALIPLGGYVKMLDENEGTVPQEELPFAFNRQPYYKKFLVVLAGPAINLLCAVGLYWLIFMIGFSTIKPVIGEVFPNSIAAKGGLVTHQEIVSINQKTTASWMSVLFQLILYAGNNDQITVTTKPLQGNTTTPHVLNLTNWHLDELRPDPLASLGITPYTPDIPLVIGTIEDKSPARHQLEVGDKIIAIDNKPVKDWQEVIANVQSHPEKSLRFTIERKGEKKIIPVKIEAKQALFTKPYGYLGITPHFSWPEELIQFVQYSPLSALTHAIHQVIDLSYFNLLLFWKMVTGKVSIQSLGGPITIFESASSAVNVGIASFLSFLAFLSVSIGIINLFPIPGLDGGHLFIQTIEAIIRRPLPEPFLINLYRLGFIFIIFIFFQALANDILRLI